MASDALKEAIEHSAAPAMVQVSVDRLCDAHDGVRDLLAGDDRLRDAVIAIAGASRSVTNFVIADPASLQTLAALDTRPALDQPDAVALRQWKQLEMLRIAVRDLLGIDDLVAVGSNLAAMAADVMREACRLAEVESDLAVIGMGKLGGSERNYASDVDVMFVGQPGVDDAPARAVMDIARTCFRVDTDLRPEGRDGPLVRSLDAFQAYWEKWAQTWEFQALIKARAVAGNPTLGSEFIARSRETLWNREFSADDLRAVRVMKARVEGELARKGLWDREVKRGRGGIRDVEFAIQLLQLVHGGADPGLRSPTTLDALAELSGGGYIAPQDGGALEDAYTFLRTVEHRLQLVDEQQVHAVPADDTARTRIARVMGYRDSRQASALEQFDDALRRHQATARSIHERVFFRPLLDTLVGSTARGALTPEVAEARLAAFGFTDAERTRQAVRELTSGLTRWSRLMRQTMPLLLAWLADSPDPDLGMLGLRRLTTGKQRSTELATAFRESPEAARRLCVLLGTSALLGNALEHNPDLIPGLGDPECLDTRARAALIDVAGTSLEWRGDVKARQPGLLRFKNRELVRVSARDILELAGENDVESTAAELTALAEAVVETALSTMKPGVPFAVVAMGRFGGAELSYASDLDLLFVYDGSTSGDFADAEATGEGLVRFLKGDTPANRIYDVDLDLRPEGKDGPLARSLDGFQTYYERWAQTWERQALLKARPIAGDPDVGQRFLDLIEPYVWKGINTDEVREIRRMKARIERERIPSGEDPQFHLKLGRGSLSDVEFTAQLLQLQHGVRAAGTMEALAALKDAGALDAPDAQVLAQAYRFCERTRNRWFLIKGSSGNSLPTQPHQLARLARSLDRTPAQLREEYRRVTRRARQVVVRVFYGVEND